tara:strand:- start:1733 stop:2128 length:396 start_codon:yes stop_codon:yes gene_type:complete
MITFAKIWYGDNIVSIESDGACAVELYYKGEPYMSTILNHRIGENKILIWNEYDKTFPDGRLFTYGGSLKIIRATAIDWDLNTVIAKLTIENIHLWPLMKGDWATSGKWDSYRRGFGGVDGGISSGVSSRY